ncbi:molybdopterin-dependent oxidoreductase [Burkholderia gladioli]|uniref:molybdopterin-dependent oxidoreductase n=1 Tax=Burkholderia gladioli TaxID=28095 RepID=UPI0016414E56|nr:molybdopterin-dependent oxidoreductase [Burkholderia gladioli]
MSTLHTACILCSRNCGLSVETEAGQFRKIRGDEATPSSKGYICQKAARLTHYQSHPDRLHHPLKRLADGSFERVSWDQALDEIAAQLNAIRKQHGGTAFALYGGGGQGNHLGSPYSRQLMKAMGSWYAYNALAQEKTGDFWLNGRMFGKQSCHTTEDVEHSDYLLVIGANPYQAHGIPNARDTLKHIHRDPDRTLVVIDPRRTETAKLADIHLQLRPGTDAYLMAAMLAIIIGEGLHDRDFLRAHCDGFDEVEQALRAVPIEQYVALADVSLGDVQAVARGYARASRACLRIDLGLQQSRNSTLNSWLEKLLFLVTGNFCIKGGNNLHASLLPVMTDTDERNPRMVRSVRHKMFAVSGFFPPNILASEIDNDGDQRIRAMFVDSGNPALTVSDTGALEAAFAKLDLLVVVDVAMTETARHAHYVLPAASQFEKCEATGFNLEFPENYFHLRQPLFPATGESLPEAEIYTRLLEKMGKLPKRLPLLEFASRHSRRGGHYMFFMAALVATLRRRRDLAPYAASIVYRTLGRRLGTLASAAPLLALTIDFARKHRDAVLRTGLEGNKFTLGARLFNHILDNPQGIVLSRHRMEDVWSLIKHPSGRIQLAVTEMIEQLRALPDDGGTAANAEFPLVLMAGERRTYNANQIYRDPGWRKQDPHGSLRIHPDDARTFGVSDGGRAMCRSRVGEIEVHVQIDADTRVGFVTLPHGYGLRFQGEKPVGPQINRLTPGDNCDPLIRTPFHKHVPVSLTALT